MSNNNISKLIILTLFLFLFYNATAQNLSIKGNIISEETKERLFGVNVFIKNTTTGTITNETGEFQLNRQNSGTVTIVFSLIGFETQEKIISIADTNYFQIKLKPATVSIAEIVVVSAKNQLTIFEQTTPVSIVTGDNIVENSTQNIPDILTQMPAVSLAGQGYHRSPSVRGLASKRVIIMVDGERISSERNEGAAGTYVNPLDIKNIEILRGPYSTLYGSDAVGGVVNIITQDYKVPLSNKYVGGIFITNYQSISNGYNANLLLNSKISDKFFIHLTAGKRKANSYKNAKGDEVQGTNFDEKSFSSKLTFKPNKNHKLQLNMFLSEADSIGKPAFSDSLNALHPNDDHYKFGVNYKLKNITPWLQNMSIKASYHKHNINARIYNYIPVKWDRVINMQKNLYNTDISCKQDFNLKITGKLKVLTGFDFYERGAIHIDEQMKSFLYDPDNSLFYLGELVYEGPQDTIIDNSYQRSYGVFAHINYSLSEKIYLNCGLRWNKFNTTVNLVNTTNMPPYDYSNNTYDKKNKNNEAFSDNFGISYLPKKNINITANIGQAFRVPSSKELFVNTITPGGMNLSNDSLVPEKSLNIDFGIKFKNKNNHRNNVSLFLFRNSIKDMIIIEWDSLHASGKFKNKNTLLYGTEFLFNYEIHRKIFINGNISYITAYESDNKEPLMNVPPFQAYTNIKYFIITNKLWFSISGKYSAKEYDVAVGDVPADDFYVFDISSGWKFNKYFGIILSVTNILNQDYREHYQYDWMRKPGRSFNASLYFTF